MKKKLGDELPRRDITRLLVGVQKTDKLSKWSWAFRTKSSTSDSGSSQGLEASQQFVQQLIIMLFFPIAKVRLSDRIPGGSAITSIQLPIIRLTW